MPRCFWMSADMAGSAMLASRYTPALMSRSTWSACRPALSRQARPAAAACSMELRTPGSVLTAVARMAVPISHLQRGDGGGQAAGHDAGGRGHQQVPRRRLAPFAAEVVVQHQEVRGGRGVAVLLDHRQRLRG